MMPQFGGQPRMGGNFGQPAPFPQMNPMQSPFAMDPQMDMNPMPQMPLPQQNPQMQPPQPQIMDNQRPVEDVELEDIDDEGQDSGNPENWLKPKIFSEGDGLV